MFKYMYHGKNKNKKVLHICKKVPNPQFNRFWPSNMLTLISV